MEAEDERSGGSAVGSPASASAMASRPDAAEPKRQACHRRSLKGQRCRRQRLGRRGRRGWCGRRCRCGPSCRRAQPLGHSRRFERRNERRTHRFQPRKYASRPCCHRRLSKCRDPGSRARWPTKSAGRPSFVRSRSDLGRQQHQERRRAARLQCSRRYPRSAALPSARP